MAKKACDSSSDDRDGLKTQQLHVRADGNRLIVKLLVLLVFAAFLLGLSVAWFAMTDRGQVAHRASATVTFHKKFTQLPLSAETRFFQHEKVNDEVDNEVIGFHNKVDLQDLPFSMHCGTIKEPGSAADPLQRVRDDHAPFTEPANLVFFPATHVHPSVTDPPDEHCKFPQMRLERRRRASFADTMYSSELASDGYFYHTEYRVPVCFHCGEKHGHAHGPRCNRHRCNVPEELLNLHDPSLADLQVQLRIRHSEQEETNQDIDVDLGHRQETNRNTDVHLANRDTNSGVFTNLEDLGKEMKIRTRDPRQKRVRHSRSNGTTSDLPTSSKPAVCEAKSMISFAEFASAIQQRAENSGSTQNVVPTHQRFEEPAEQMNPPNYSTFDHNDISPSVTNSDMTSHAPCSCNDTQTAINQGRGNSQSSASYGQPSDRQQNFSVDTGHARPENHTLCMTGRQIQERTKHPSSCINANPACATQSHHSSLDLALTGNVHNTDMQSGHNPKPVDSGGGASHHVDCGPMIPADERQSCTTLEESSQPFLSPPPALKKRQNNVTVVVKHTDQETQGAESVQSPQNVSECTVNNQPKKRCPKCGPVSKPQTAYTRCPNCGLKII